MPKLKLVSFTLLSAFAIPLSAQQTLPKLQLAEHITLSGLSSGAYMAGQYHLAFAEQVSGVAMLAGGPVYCAQNSLGLALEHCFNKASSSPDMNAINQYLTAQRATGKLAPVAAVKDDKVWIFHGSKDTTVYPGLAAVLYQQYRQWVDSSHIALITDKPFGHTFPTDNTALGSCDVSEPPFLASCNYDAAGELLKHLLGSVKAKTASSSGRLITINQHQLAAAAKDALAETGYLYIPQSCASGESCRLHVSFHGCKQNAASVGEAYVTGSGLNNYADSNNIVVLYPQTTASSINPFNPNACWDWWGYTGADYATKEGIQLKAIHQLVQALTD
ncbi:poly(3-hydroxybutyrate) depolymerase [Rheinheimera pacifica]|uniref:extracellular catalytic domain type 2 short-chain-length polyhydroxyalkanoate depolymerase n=1 Tax=Rheinheimera pacifica TaxID=173990 RepID=UPI00216A0BDE|nr:PHB depolymerase family esterase [Rheinheimera pacifica]MCS4309107.1 poly(3-hydroxybutyrate) depolymerase [Rheinheimera pacifica]